MTDDERALVAAVAADPDNQLPRLVYSDWLEEHGWPERAESVRVGVALESVPRAEHLSPAAAALARRLSDLASVRTAWADDWMSAVPVNRQTFLAPLGGVPLDLCCTGKYLVEHDAVLADRLVVGRLSLRRPTARRVSEIARTRVWGRLTMLSLTADEVPTDALDALLDRLPAGLRRLTLHSPIGYASTAPPPPGWLERSAERVARLAAHPAVAGLWKLDLSRAGIGEAGATALSRSPHLGGLVRLTVVGNHLPADAAEQLRWRFGDRVALRDPWE